MASVIRPDMGSYKSEQNRFFGDQAALKAEAERLGKTGTAEYACHPDGSTWMRTNSFGGESMVANSSVSDLTYQYNYLPCSTVGTIKTCKAGELNQVIDTATGHVIFTEDGTDYKLECDPA